MKSSRKILIIALVVIVAVAGYFAYTQYNDERTREHLLTSYNLEANATDYFNQALSYEEEGDYSRAIATYQKSDDETSRVLTSDKQALTYASGVYREYLDKDIQLQEKILKLIEYKIYLNQYNNNSLNQGQEKVPPEMLVPYIDKLTGEVSNLKDERDKIILENPDAFSF